MFTKNGLHRLFFIWFGSTFHKLYIFKKMDCLQLHIFTHRAFSKEGGGLVREVLPPHLYINSDPSPLLLKFLFNCHEFVLYLQLFFFSYFLHPNHISFNLFIYSFIIPFHSTAVINQNLSLIESRLYSLNLLL